MASIETRQRAVFRASDEMTESRHAPEPGGLAVMLDGIGKRFGAREVLRDLSLAIAPGEFLAIVGHSGCGKSTLLRLVAGLDTPTSGRLAVGGRPVAGQVAEARILFQDARLLPWRRVIDNVGIGLKGNWRADAAAALRAVGLESRSGDWPAALSGGQRQRVALARALVSRPRLLLLDEPLGALDALTRLEMQDLLEQVWREQGFTALLVTHDVAEAVALADRVIVLENGTIGQDRRILHQRPRPRGDAALAATEGEILAQLMRRGTARGREEGR
jgi:sulfonate transport system ATP-binding protein